MQSSKLRMPKNMHLNLTLACNLKCRICRPEDFDHKINVASLSKESIDKIINEAFDSLEQLRLDSAGELLLSRHLPYVLEEATRRNIPIFVSTNGTLMTEQKAEMLCRASLDVIQVSLDSPEKETLEWIRKGAKLDDVIQGAANLVTVRRKLNKGKPRIDFHAAILRQNLEQLPDLINLSTNIGVDAVGLAYGYTHSFMDPDWSVFWSQEKCNEILKNARLLADRLKIGFNAPASFSDDTKIISIPARYCHYLFEWTYIDPRGKVFPCCIGTYEVGDLKDSSFTDIWYGGKYSELRSTYNTATPAYSKCSSCYITSVWNPDDYKSHFHPDHWDYVEKRISLLPKKEYKKCIFGEYIFPGDLSEPLDEIAKLQNENRLVEAIELLERTISNHPDLPELYNLYVDLVFMAGDNDKARTALNLLSDRWPVGIHTANSLALLAIKDKEFSRALDILKQVVAVEPVNRKAKEYLGILKEQVEFERAKL